MENFVSKNYWNSKLFSITFLALQRTKKLSLSSKEFNSIFMEFSKEFTKSLIPRKLETFSKVTTYRHKIHELFSLW